MRRRVVLKLSVGGGRWRLLDVSVMICKASFDSILCCLKLHQSALYAAAPLADTYRQH
jgi:hypothetical protein